MKRIVLFLILLFAASLGTAYAIGTGGAVVDGNPNEWNPAVDFFSKFYVQGDVNKQEAGSVYVRIQCDGRPQYVGTKAFLYFLVETTVPLDLSDSARHFVKGAAPNGPVWVNGLSGNDDNPPDFAYIPGDQGWEASAWVDAVDYPTLWIHTQIVDAAGQSQTADPPGHNLGIPLSISCDPTAVQLNLFSGYPAPSLCASLLLVLGASLLIFLGYRFTK